MSDPPMLGAEEIRSALERLGELAARDEQKVELVAVGRAVMVLDYRERKSTTDVDAVFLQPRPTAPIRR